MSSKCPGHSWSFFAIRNGNRSVSCQRKTILGTMSPCVASSRDQLGSKNLRCPDSKWGCLSASSRNTLSRNWTADKCTIHARAKFCLSEILQTIVTWQRLSFVQFYSDHLLYRYFSILLGTYFHPLVHGGKFLSCSIRLGIGSCNVSLIWLTKAVSDFPDK